MDIDTFQILADPARRTILQSLIDGERPVNDLVDLVGIKQSGVSRHLRILYEAGFVAVRPDGQRRLYSLAPEPFYALDQWLDQYRGFWEDRLDRFGRALEVRQNQQSKKGVSDGDGSD